MEIPVAASNLRQLPQTMGIVVPHFAAHSTKEFSVANGHSKRKADEEHLMALSTVAKCSEQMLAMMQNAEVQWQQLIDIAKERIALWALKEENRILLMNHMSVDESVRAYLLQEQQRVWGKEQRTGMAPTGRLVRLASSSAEVARTSPIFRTTRLLARQHDNFAFVSVFTVCVLP